MAGSGRIRGKADNGDGFGNAEKVEDGIGGRLGVIWEIEIHQSWMRVRVEWLW